MSKDKQMEFIFDSEKEETLVSIPVGIHSNVSIVSIDLGDTYFDINFEDTLKRQARLRAFEPQGKYPRQKDGVTETEEEAIARESQENASILSRLMKIFEAPRVTATDYNDYVEKCVKALSPRLAKAKVNLKLIYDGDFKYSRFPKYDFVERYEEGVPPTLTYSKWELENRVTKPEPKTGGHDLL